jgi:hypothetical protein
MRRPATILALHTERDPTMFIRDSLFVQHNVISSQVVSTTADLQERTSPWNLEDGMVGIGRDQNSPYMSYFLDSTHNTFAWVQPDYLSPGYFVSRSVAVTAVSPRRYTRCAEIHAEIPAEIP